MNHTGYMRKSFCCFMQVHVPNKACLLGSCHVSASHLATLALGHPLTRHHAMSTLGLHPVRPVFKPNRSVDFQPMLIELVTSVDFDSMVGFFAMHVFYTHCSRGFHFCSMFFGIFCV